MLFIDLTYESWFLFQYNYTYRYVSLGVGLFLEYNLKVKLGGITLQYIVVLGNK